MNNDKAFKRNPAPRHVILGSLKADIFIIDGLEMPKWQLNAYRRSMEEILAKQFNAKVKVHLEYKSHNNEN